MILCPLLPESCGAKRDRAGDGVVSAAERHHDVSRHVAVDRPHDVARFRDGQERRAHAARVGVAAGWRHVIRGLRRRATAGPARPRRPSSHRSHHRRIRRSRTAGDPPLALPATPPRRAAAGCRRRWPLPAAPLRIPPPAWPPIPPIALPPDAPLPPVAPRDGPEPAAPPAPEIPVAPAALLPALARRPDAAPDGGVRAGARAGFLTGRSEQHGADRRRPGGIPGRNVITDIGSRAVPFATKSARSAQGRVAYGTAPWPRDSGTLGV